MVTALGSTILKETPAMRIKCPPLSRELIAYLDAVYPDRVVDPSATDPAFAFGQVSVVRHLKAVAEAQEETPDVFT